MHDLPIKIKMLNSVLKPLKHKFYDEHPNKSYVEHLSLGEP